MTEIKTDFFMSIKNEINKEKVPKHIAIIMDGNGRWAKKHGKMRLAGHNQGAKTLKNIIKVSANIGVKYLTVYAFSQENWNRPTTEVEGLMNLLVSSIDQEIELVNEKKIRIMVIGDIAKLPQKVKKKVKTVMELTKNYDEFSIIIALSYSGRWEIANTAKKIANDVLKNKIKPEDINETVFYEYLNELKLPEPELLIRTSGESRISNFLLFQLAYTELYFTEVLWPDFSEEELFKAIIEYQKRERRFGKTSEQLNN